MTDDAPQPSRLRPRTASSSRASALTLLKSIRSGTTRPGPQIKLEAPIYDQVDDDEYQTLVKKRKDDYKSFIVDDEDGLGYGDDGEEDWSIAGGHDESEEEEGEGEEREKKRKPKREGVKKVSPLDQAANLIGKQKLSNMFTTSVYKTKNLSCDSVVEDVLAELEFAPDESDREKRRRVLMGNSKLIKKEKPDVEKKKNACMKNEEKSNLVEEYRNSENGSVLRDEEMMLQIAQESESMKEIETVTSRDIDEEVPETTLQKISDENGDTCVKESFVLNARVREEKDPALSATAGWQAISNAGNGGDVAMNSVSGEDEKPDFAVDNDGSLPFYILDAHEEFYGENAGNVYLFGKVKTGSVYQSCCVVVKNMQRCVYAIPKGGIFKDDEITKLGEDAKESRISATALRTKLQEMASELKTEIAKQLLDHNVSSFSMAPVKRNYAFERSDIPSGENYALKINYPFKDPPLSSDLKGETFSALLGTRSSALELFLVKRKIKGPSWLSVLRFCTCSSQRHVSWCKFEVIVECPKDIQISASSKIISEIPPVVVTAINVKTVINEKHNTNEIVSASLVSCHKAKIDAPTLTSELERPGMLSHFAVVQKLKGEAFPARFLSEVKDRNAKAGQDVIGVESSERALLSRLMNELHKLDSDVILGHNISGFDLDVILHKAQTCKLRGYVWSKIGRLKRSIMPKLSKSNTAFGSGASPGIMSCMAGRLLCDTFLCSRDLLREVSYSLTHLTKTQLNKDRKEIAPSDVPSMFKSSEKLLELIECCETDAWLSMKLMFHMSILPLTRQLTNISGNLWGKTLQGARAQRVEYLLLHAFHSKKFMVPDKFYSPAKETKGAKRKVNDSAVEKDITDVDVDNASVEDNALQGDIGKAKKGPSYLGGLVLEPKKGLYDKYILLLDFNSLYPSIIQEYNICFTTVERSHDGSSVLPTSKKTGVLPELLKNLVERRKQVKTWLKSASGLKAQQLDIQQQALKLTANSMYGCLGFSSSRFYAKPLAEMITLQGREILLSTVDLVQNNLNLEVIYGDTDSIMINSGLNDIDKAKSIARTVIDKVNEKYKCLEIDLDGLYKRMLLLKKKKYAAVKVQFKDGTSYEVPERKGLDMVRRDWSLLSKDIGNFCLDKILSGGSCEDVVESIHNALMKVKDDTRSGQVPLEKYVITKTLTKRPEEYPDGKNQPHVVVALRRKMSGHFTDCSVGDTVPYVICTEQGTSSGNSTGIAQRARHPDELEKDNGKWIVDIDYYLSQQIHPVVSRLCASIQGTSPARLADCLGLDSSKFQSKSTEVGNSDPSTLFLSGVDDDERYAGCRPLVITCPGCLNTFDCPSISSSVSSLIRDNPIDTKEDETSQNFWCKLRCRMCPEGDISKISPAMIANQVMRQADGFINTYYKGLMVCDDETCKYRTRSLNLRVLGESERGTTCPNYPRCNGHLIRKYTEADLYKQLSYFCYVLDTVRCLDKMEQKIKLQVERELGKLQPVVELAASTAQKMRDRCAFGWVQLKDLFEIV